MKYQMHFRRTHLRSSHLLIAPVTRDVLEHRGERFVSREVLTKRRYVLDKND
jgi:hypothetical protein